MARLQLPNPSQHNFLSSAIIHHPSTPAILSPCSFVLRPSLTAAMAANSTTLHLLKLLLQALNCRMGTLQILIQTITLTNKLLLPLSEPMLLNLNLLSESLSQRLFLLLELGVVKLTRSGLTEFASLHLLSAIGFIVGFFGSVDEIEHVGSDEDGTELLKVAVVFVLDFGNSPAVLTTLDDPTIRGLDVFLGTDHGKWHSGHKGTCMLGGGLIIFLHWWCVNLDALGLDDRTDL